ncbi:MAG: tetratricopeptide repeat protein [Gemmatimonadaceae bacterium]
MLHLKVLGSLLLLSDTGAVPAAAQQKRRLGLLALLAIAGDRGISRDRLQSFLWPDSPPEKSRHALDQLIYAVRRALGTDPIFSEGRDLRLDRSVVRTDLEAFAVAMRERRWEDAVAEYGGPLLEGFYVSDNRDLESWIDSERMRIDQDYRSSLEALARSAALRGDNVTAVAWWRRLAASDPLSSRIAIEVIQALAASGENPAAIQHARNYERLVREELEIEPDPRIGALTSTLSPRIESPAVPRKPRVSASAATRERPLDPDPPSRKSSKWRVAAVPLAGLVLVGMLLTDWRKPTHSSPAVSTTMTVSAEAKEFYLRGMNAWANRTKEGFDTAVVSFRRAIEIEPAYAEAYGGLANAYVLLGYSGYRPANAMFPKAKAAALRAIDLDSTLAAPYAALGLELTWERRFAEAEAAFRKSIALDPSYPTAHQWYGMLLKILGRLDEAVAETRRAAELDPLSPQIQNTYATFLSASGDAPAALRQYEKMIGEEPDSAWVQRNPWLLTNMAAVYAANGLMVKALDAAERSVSINPTHPRSLMALASIHIKLGHPDSARKIFARVDKTNEHYAAEQAFFYLEMGMRDSAFAQFDRVKEWPVPIMISLGANARLRGDRRYYALLKKIGIPAPIGRGVQPETQGLRLNGL